MKFMFDGIKFYLLFDDGIPQEVSEQVWNRLMAKVKKEQVV